MDYKERRRFERFRVNLDAHWEGALERQRGTVQDLSLGGCFILTAHKVKIGELIRINMGDLSIWGEVIYEIKEMGFAIRFGNYTGDPPEFTEGAGADQTQLDQVIAAATAAAANATEQEEQPK